jgi:rod shape-determining protein MreD
MRFVPYFILAYIALGMQVGLSGYIRVESVPPNLVLLAALFIALNAPKEAALLGCFGLGLMQDLLTQQTMGIYALSYGLVAMFIISTQQLVYREHPLTHVSIALSASIICAVVMILHDLFRMSPDERTSLSTLVYASLYTTVLSPIVLGVMQKLRRAFGFQSRRLRM